ncbi:MAG: CoB--CoM heterodisulfide reductase iron-sulfur subunit B family protein [Candidatus Aminicenantes bacterium]|nr:MAG: CoB--CoM heterodisulfide reductase iron-sulfur subunit B family protein [Candidatus Aminicenantes bacterium]
MKISYYPGCTLKNHAKNFEDSTICSLNAIGVEVEELNRWNCCGTVFSLTTDDLIHHVAPIRNLIRVKEANYEKVMTVCAMCYNTLKRANERVKSDPESLDILNDFMDREEVQYDGDVQIFHLLEFLRDEIGFANLAQKVVKPLKKLKIASYYGCLLVRPKEIGFDDMENPTILDDLMSVLGADSVDFPFKTECCGAYQTVDKPDIIADRTNQILTSTMDQGAEMVVVSCPLCAFNLDQRQKQTVEKYPEFKHMPVMYFTQALAIALGCPEETLRFDLNFIDPKPILKEKGLI